MKHVVIIGAGFCGLNVAERLSRFSKGCSVTLIDKKTTFDFLPILPDIIGGRISPGHAAYDLSLFAKNRKIRFLCEKVDSVDHKNKCVSTDKQNVNYDYLVIASGTETAYYGNAEAMQYGYCLESVEDAKKILRELNENPRSTYIIVGGGYTGVEVATNIWRYFKKQGVQKKIVIVEKMRSILRVFPDMLRKYCETNLSSLGIKTRLNAEIRTIEQDRAVLSSGEEFSNCMVLWVPGVNTGEFVRSLKINKNRQGRIDVDKYLRVNDNCFVVGDAAEVFYKEKPLRMAVQFTLTQGANVAKNIISCIRGEKLKPYDPIVDFGYICPMGNNRSCGNVLGLNIKGILPTLLHYFMCSLRMHGLRNKFGILKDVILNPNNNQ